MPVREPSTTRDHGFDYTAELGADTIAASTWTADAGLTLTAATFDATATTVWISVGAATGQTLTATNRVTTAAGRTYERVLTLFIRAAVDPLDDYAAIAADTVQELAPAPSPLPTPDTYSPKAARAERLLVNWLSSTSGGSLTAATLTGTGSATFSGMSVVRGIVSRTMGTYYTGGTGGSYTLEVESTFPPASEGA